MTEPREAVNYPDILLFDAMAYVCVSVWVKGSARYDGPRLLYSGRGPSCRKDA